LEGVVTEGSADELERAYRGSKVLLTGHTGFKGAWLTVWLTALGAEVTGLALRPPTDPSLFDDLRLASRCDDIEGDVRDIGTVEAAIQRAAPDYVFHLAAQAIVHEGFRRPLETFETNVIGTANVLEAIRRRGRPCAVVIVTSDKCYAVVGEAGPRHEDDPLGGADPYSASKAAAEILTAGLRSSFFPPDRISAHGVAVATARAGNVIGGGDWALDRIVPDAMRALQMRRAIPVRNPGHVRPWQHVLEPLSGYLLLGMRLSGDGGDRYCEAWNFGPPPDEERTVGELTEALIREWGSGTWQAVDGSASHRETPVLRLDIAKACSRLAWRPRWDLATALGHSVEWYRARQDGVRPEGLYALCLRQIEAYTQA
jgi:CDP-glucose 4,6-dehydratase